MNVVKVLDEKADEKLSMIVQTANWKFTGEKKSGVLTQRGLR